jgi:hypothetical protein
VTDLELADQLRARTRAVRRARSWPLIALGVGVLAVAALQVSVMRWSMVEALVPVLVFAALMIAERLARSRRGVGTGRDGHLAALLVAVGLLIIAPVVSFLLGAVLVLGLGAVLIGTRARDAWIWGAGLVLMAVSPLVSLGVVDNHLEFLGPRPPVVLLSVLGLGLVGLGVRAAADERDRSQGLVSA